MGVSLLSLASVLLTVRPHLTRLVRASRWQTRRLVTRAPFNGPDPHASKAI